MKLFTFSLIVIAVVFTGCSTENPLCTDNYCVEGEIYPRSDLPAGQDFGDLPINDTVIFAAIVGGATPIETDVETPVVGSVSFDDIVADAAVGGTQYVGETATITAPVRFVFETAVTLVTKNQVVSFYIKSPNAPEKLNALVEGKTYQFTLQITSIAPPDEEFDTYAVFSNITSDASLVDVRPLEVTVASVVADVANDGTAYLGQTIQVDATVFWETAELEGSGLALTTHKNDVIWVVVHNDKTVLDSYVKDESYTFTLLIESITPPDTTKVDPYYSIRSIFIEAE